MKPSRIEDHASAALRRLPRQHERDAASNWGKLMRALCGTLATGKVFEITAYDVTAKTYTVNSDCTGHIFVGHRILVTGLDGADDSYWTVAEVTPSGTDTVLTVEEDVIATLGGATASPVIGSALQSLEEVMFVLRLARTLAHARGDQLDLLGDALGLPRTDSDDDIYRAALRAQAAINASSGTIEELIAAALAFGASAVWILEVFPAHIQPFLFGTSLTPYLRAKLRATKAAGVGMEIVSADSDGPIFGFGADRDDVGTEYGEPRAEAGAYSDAFPITSYTVLSKLFVVDGDASSAIVSGQSIAVYPQSGSRALYTVDTVTYQAGPTETEIVVVEAVSDPGADAQIVPQEAAVDPPLGAFADAFPS